MNPTKKQSGSRSKKLNIKNGSFVSVLLKDGSILEGVVIPSVDEKTLMIKLESGYNTGIQYNNIRKLEVKNRGKQVVETKKIVVKEKDATPSVEKAGKSKTRKPTITILHTGGTIASKVDYKTGAVIARFKPEDLIEMFPEIKQFANIKSRLVFNMWSQDMRFSHYNRLALEVKKEVEEGVDGIIITHGTDTLHYTAAALSFILEKLPIPVLLVGSQRSSDRASSDSALNLINAVYFISNSDFSEVAICMHNSMNDDFCAILPGTKTRKMHTSRRDAFKAINSKPFALVDYKSKTIKFINRDYKKKNNNTDRNKIVELKLFKENIKVGMLKQHTNMYAEEFSAFKDYDGLVIESTGLGNLPITQKDDSTLEHKKILKALELMIKKGTIVVLAPQTIFGRLNMNVYENQRKQLDIGILGHENDMTPETTFIKLAWLLSNFTKKEIINNNLIMKNFRGETTLRTTTNFDVQYD